MKSKIFWIFLLFFPLFSLGQSIQGNSTVCVGSSTILSCNACGIPPTSPTSAWSSSNSSVASIDVNGMVTGLNAGTVTITYTDNGGSTVTASFTVGAIPTLVNNGSITYFCQENINQNIGFTSNPSFANNSIKWYDSNLSPIIPNPSAITVDCNIPQNDTNYISQVSLLGCEGPKSEVVTVVVATPAVPVTQDLDYCVGDNAPALTAQADIGNTLQWFKSTSPNTVTNSINPSTSNPGQETWLVRQIKQVPINQVCIGPKSSLTVTTHANPNPPTVPTTSFSYCIDETAIQLSATPDAGHQLIWYGPGNTQSLTAPTPPTSTPGVFTYNVTQQNTLAQNCESSSIAITVTVLDKAQKPSFSGGVLPVEYCVGDASIPLAASSSTQGVLIWYNEDGTLTSSNFGVGGAPTPPTDANAVGTTNYKVILDPNNSILCPSDTLIIPVIVHPNPVITTSNQSVCEGGSVTLSATGAGSGGSYYWNGGVVNNSAITITPQVTTTYTVTGTDQYGCQGTEDATVTVLDLPITPSTTSTNETLCQEVGTYIPSVTAGAGNSLTWYASNGTSVISGPPSINKNTLGTYTYYVSQTNSNGCESEKLQITINIVAVPTAPTTNPISYCKDEIASSLVATPGSGYILQWYDSDGTTVLSSAPTPQTTSTGITTYYVSQITSNNCESPKAPISVSINDLPVPPSATPNAYVYCIDDIATTLSASALANHSLKWFDTDGSTVLSNAPTPPTTISGNTDYYVSQIDNSTGCESPQTSINIDVKPAVAIPVASPGNQTEYCENEFATALVASGNGGNLIWYNSDGTLTNTNLGVGGGPTPSTTSSAIGTTQYYVVQQSLITGCDSDPLYVDVEVYANPTITTTSTVSSCAGEAVTLNGNGAGTGGSYSWDGGVVDGISFVPPFSNTSTTYTVTGTDVNGCQNTATATLTVNSNPNTPTVIANAYDYCIDAIATPLLANASFNHTLIWYNSDGVSVLTAPFTPPTSTTGTFTYYVSQIDNSTGCESPTESIDVIVGIGIPSPITYDRSVCRNDFSTLLTATKLPGNTLNWFDPNGNALSFAPTYNTLIPGTTSYYVSQYDPVTGCESPQDTIDVVVNDLPNISAGTDFEICLGESTIVSASGAGIGGSYSWSSGLSDGVSFDPTATSTYTVTGTDANGCSAADDITITVNTIPSSPTTDPNSKTTFITGSVSSVLSAISLPGFTLTWYNSDGTLVNGNGSAPTPSTDPANVGITEYLVTQTSTSGCESAPLTVQVVVLGVNVSNDTTICLTDTAQLLVSTYSVNTSTFNSTGYTFIGTYNGSDYYISPIDTSWSEVRSRATSDGGDLVNITDSAENYFVTQGLMPYSSTSFGPYYYMGIYQDLSSSSYAEPSGGWFNIDSTLVSHTNWKPGEPNNLFGTEHFGEIVIDSATQVEFWNDVPDTQSNKYGVIEVPTSNSPSWSYLWSTGDTTSTINVNPLMNTQYWVAISDGNNTWYDSVNVSVNLLDINITQTDTILCAGDSSGTLGVDINPGNGPYQYLWNTGSTLDSLKNVTVGTYSVTVTDGMGCSASDAINIVSPNLMTLTTQSISNYSGFDISCSGEADAVAYANANGGTPGYTYLWSNGATGDTVSSLSFGTYFVTVIDSNGCSTLDTLILTEPLPLALNISSLSNVFGNQIDCYGDSTGVLFSALVGGAGGYSYTWNNGSTIDSIYNLGAGTYWVTAQDTNGCTLTDTVTLTQPSLPFTTTASTQSNFNGFGISCNGGNDGSISVSAQGSNAPYSYAWSNGATTASQSNLGQGTYTVVVTDSLGCISNANVSVTEPSLLTYSYIIDDVSCYLGQNGSIEIIPQGGVMPYDIQWFNGTDSTVLDSLSSGYFAFTIIDQNNCLVIDSVEIYEPAEIEITVDTIQPTCERLNDGQIDAFIYGGTYPYSYMLNGSPVNLPLDSVAVGSYILTVVDSNSCTQTIAFDLEPLQPSCFMIPNMYSPNYDGYNDEFRIRHSSWSSYTLTIYNSIGQLVYSGSSSTPYWDGITSGDSMPTGDYYYQLITNEGEVIYGYVTLIR